MISVAMTTYNGERFLKEQLDSIFNQTRKVDEIIVCDDGSIDKTLEILKNYPVTVYQNERNLGYRLNFKKAMQLCHGDYIFLCDQDDVWQENKVEEMINIINGNPNIHVLTSAFHYIDENGKEILKDKINLYPKKIEVNTLHKVEFKEYLAMNYFQGCSICMDAWIKNKVINHFNDNLEHDWLINVIAASYEGMYFYNKPLFKYRLHENNSLGVEYITQSSQEHMNQANTEKIRSQNAKNALIVLDVVKENNLEFYKKNENEFIKLKEFLLKHIKYIKNKNFFDLLFQNFSPFYKQIKTKKARMMDLLYCLK